MAKISKAADSPSKSHIKIRKESQFVEDPRHFRWKYDNSPCKP